MSNMPNFDIKKKLKAQYGANDRKIDTINVVEMPFMMIDGIGNPTEDEFKLKSSVLKSFSKEIKEILKEKEISYTLPPLEGLWDTYDNSHFDVTRKQLFDFTLMMSLPFDLDESVLDLCKQRLIMKIDNPYIMDVYYKKLEEGRCVQILHKGAYHTEIETTKKIMEYITVENMRLVGMHHEIYLNDPKKVAPDDLKTIVRYAIEDA